MEASNELNNGTVAFRVTGRHGLDGDYFTILLTRSVHIAQKLVAAAQIEMPHRQWRIIEEQFPSVEAFQEAQTAYECSPYRVVG